jgi:hypothetical protein
MPSTYTTSLRLEKQANGENLNTWGDRLNTVIDLVEEAVAGWESITVTGSFTLTSTNAAADQARNAVLNLTGTPSAGFTVTAPSAPKIYFVRNETGQTATFSAGGTTCTVTDGEFVLIATNGTDFHRFDIAALGEVLAVGGTINVTGGITTTGACSFGGALDMNSNKITEVTDPTSNQDAATKKYVDDNLATAAGSGVLPGATNNAYKTLRNNAAETGQEWEYAIAEEDASSVGKVLGSQNAADNRGVWTEIFRAERITAGETLVSRAQPYYADSTGGSFTLTLPASPSEGDTVTILVGPGSAASPYVLTNAITIARNGETIAGAAEDFTVTRANYALRLTYLDSGWRVNA